MSLRVRWFDYCRKVDISGVSKRNIVLSAAERAEEAHQGISTGQRSSEFRRLTGVGSELRLMDHRMRLPHRCG